MSAEIAVTKGCLPCVVPSRATALRFPRLSWSRLKRLSGNGLFRTSCANGPHWCCTLSSLVENLERQHDRVKGARRGEQSLVLRFKNSVMVFGLELLLE